LPFTVRNGALAAGVALSLTGRGDLWTLALVFGVADSSAVTSLVVFLVGIAALARSGSATIGDLSGAQAVLGPAGATGSALVVAAAWCSAVGLVLAARDRWTGIGLGALAGLMVAGPALAGGAASVAVWIGGVGLGSAAGWLLSPTNARLRWQPWVAVALGAAAAGLGIAGGYR